VERIVLEVPQMANATEHDAWRQANSAREEWVRERLVTRLYEPLPPEEEAEVKAYLQTHPELQYCEIKYQEIAKRIGELEGLDDPIGDEEVHTLVSAYQDRIRRSRKRVRSRVMQWLGTAAVAASMLALMLSKGILVQVGQTRITLGHVVQTPALDDEKLGQRMRGEIAQAMASFLTAVHDQIVDQNERIEEIYQLREIDRQETRNTIQKLAQLTGMAPRGRIAYANPLFRAETSPDVKDATAEQLHKDN
jgi:hypothetical protein